MKRFALVLICVLSAYAVIYAAGKKDIRIIVFDTNLHCEKCVEKVTENISFEKGVVSLDVSLENQAIAIGYDARKTSAEKLAASIVKLGYKADLRPAQCGGNCCGQCSTESCGKYDKAAQCCGKCDKK